MVQVNYLLFIDSNSNEIALIAMCFSMLSVILTLFEYSSKKFSFESKYLMVLRFKVDSSVIRSMTQKEWKENVSNKREYINNYIVKVLNIDFNNVEQLKPAMYTQGAIITCHVCADVTSIDTNLYCKQ